MGQGLKLVSVLSSHLNRSGRPKHQALSPHRPSSMRRVVSLAFAFLLLAFAATSARALEDENLLVSMPKGYKIGYQKRAANQAISEMVPQAETVDDWSEMVTVQIFFSMRGVTPAQYRNRLEGL